MEYNIKKYQFHQNGKDYVVSTGLVYDRIRITCQENLALDGPFYSNEFSLYELQAIHQFFKLTSTIEEALKEINKGIERQKSGLKLGSNDIMHFLGYLVIGTDNDAFVLNLKRNYEPNKYGIFTPPSTGAADLILSTNYKIDGQRIYRGEINAGNLQREQTMIEEELDRIIPQLNKLKKMSMDIEEENALIKERIRLLQKKLEQKKYNVYRLKEENANLKRENQNLINMINENQNAIRNKQAIQTKIKIKSRPNVIHQPSAIVSKYEQPAIRTFFPRTGAKHNINEYNQNQYNNYNYEPNIIYNPPITTTNSYEDMTNQIPIQTQYVYQAPQPVILNVQQPLINPSQSKILKFSNKSYNNTYRVYLKAPLKDTVYQNKVNIPNFVSTSNNNNIINIYNKNMIRSSSYNNVNLGTLKDNIGTYNNNNGNEENYSNKNNQYIKPNGSRMPKANIGNFSMSPSQNKNRKRNSPEIGYSNYNPDIDNKNK